MRRGEERPSRWEERAVEEAVRVEEEDEEDEERVFVVVVELLDEDRREVDLLGRGTEDEGWE